jgi:putative transposase
VGLAAGARRLAGRNAPVATTAADVTGTVALNRPFRPAKIGVRAGKMINKRKVYGHRCPPGLADRDPAARLRPGPQPAEGVWANMKNGLANLAASNAGQLAAIARNRLKRIQYRPALIDGFLAQTGLTLEPEPP